ncbi:uncharacterized protein [Argopecten irradians]|uniref:uncharacterized protein n=1 Tax=Argopecten irradians TaxID=31199 RepID=UPI00371AA914
MRFRQSPAVFLVSLVVTYIATVNSYALQKTASDTLLDQHNADNPDVQMPMEKRAVPLSLNGDLRMLARMLFASQRRRRVDQYANVRQQMTELGKRNGNDPFGKVREDSIGNEQDSPELRVQHTKLRPAFSKFQEEESDALQNLHSISPMANLNGDDLQKRGQRLSINGALSSLADMLEASGRRRLAEELAVNKERLLKLGR